MRYMRYICRMSEIEIEFDAWWKEQHPEVAASADNFDDPWDIGAAVAKAQEVAAKAAWLAARSSAPERSGWVDVQERLPEIGKHVLWYVEFEGCKIGKYSPETTPYPIHPSITHWRPLPAPPKAKTDTEVKG
jgi:hypothetical protein